MSHSRSKKRIVNIPEAAHAWHTAGASVLPAIRGKRPALPWTAYQNVPSDPTEWRWGDYHGLGIVTGYNHIEMLEIEGTAIDLLHPLTTAFADAGLIKLVTYMEATPSGGIHWLYHVEGDQEGSTKLARDETGKTMIETRGKYAWVIVAPSGGDIHEEIPGGQWQLIGESHPGRIPTFTEEEHGRLFDVCREFDRKPPPTVVEHRERISLPGGELAPGHDYAARHSWEDLLGADGWTITLGRRPVGRYWTRPGKNHGVSATITDDGNLYVFSTSAYPLESSDDAGSYTKFRYYSITQHNGDDSQAAKQLRHDGYGTPHAATTVGHDTPQPNPPPEPPQATTGPSPPPSRDDTTKNLVAAGLADDLTLDERSLAESEDGLAILMRRRYHNRVRYCPERGKWLSWNGALWEWQPEGGGVVREYYKRIARGLPATEKHEIRWKQNCLRAMTVTSVVRLLQTDPQLVITHADLDSRADELNTPTGIVLMRTAQLIPHDPAHLHTKITLVGPNPSGNHQLWNQFLAQTFAENNETISFMARLVGVSSSGYTEPHILPFCSGTGGNGKGVFVDTTMAILKDYATPAPPNFLMAGPVRHLTELADLQGRRMVVASEVNEDDRFDEAKMKRLTGGDPIKANYMRQNMFTFTPTHHLWLVGNHRPAMANSSTNESVWRRLREIPFAHEVPEEERIDGLKDRLVAECGPAIMAWIVHGAADYFSRGGLGQRGGLDIPEAVEAATADYRSELDSVGQFLTERCHIGGGNQVTVAKTTVYEAYKAFCQEIGAELVSHKAFTQALHKKGFVDDRRNRMRFWFGLTLLRSEDENDDDDDDASVTVIRHLPLRPHQMDLDE